jgi:hypothetical protein
MSCGTGLSCDATSHLCINAPPCSRDADCCSGLCQNGNCATGGESCVPIGGACTSTGDCCTRTCNGGFCNSASF